MSGGTKGAKRPLERPLDGRVYLGRYLYRGVIQERDILRCDDNGNVTFQYRDAKTDKMAVRTLHGADFLWLVLQHVLPKGLRRSRNFGFLHPNSAAAVRLMQLLHLRAAPAPAGPAPARPAWRCACGQPMHVVRRRMAALQPQNGLEAQPWRVNPPDKPDAVQASTCTEDIIATLGNGLKPARCIRSPENRSRPRKIPGIDTRQPSASAFSTLAGFPSAVLAAGPFGPICSVQWLGHRRAACSRACPTNGSDRGFARSILNLNGTYFGVLADGDARK